MAANDCGGQQHNGRSAVERSMSTSFAAMVDSNTTAMAVQNNS
jgi:hypothetical protein